MTKRAEFTTLTKLKAMARYARCPGVFELGIKCGKHFGTLSETEFDHIMRNEIKPDASPENCRPLCKDCHKAKTLRKDTIEAKKGRNIRGENKPKRKAKIQSRGFPSPEERRAVKEKYERVR
jgi:hypothetical protein